MSLFNEHVGPKLSAKIKNCILTRAVKNMSKTLCDQVTEVLAESFNYVKYGSSIARIEKEGLTERAIILCKLNKRL